MVMNDLRPKPSSHDQDRKKLQRLPPGARITKRPLLRPAIQSPYAGSSQPKVVYVSARASFMPVIKRVEKLLHLADKRITQSAAASTEKDRRTNARIGRNKHGTRGVGAGDELLEIARTAERLRKEEGKGPVNAEVIIKGTGKAVQKVLEFGLWFQQREDRFVVRLRTGSVGAIDDVEDDEVGGDGDLGHAGMAGDDGGLEDVIAEGVDEEVVGGEQIDQAALQKGALTDAAKKMEPPEKRSEGEALPETRIRYTSSLEVAVRLR